MQRTDPRASSPAGVIYQIPLDTGRRDAAPVLPVGSRHSAASGQDGSASAAGVSGATGSAPQSGTGTSGANGESSSAEASAGGGTPGDPSSIHSENGFGSSSQVPGVSPAAVRIGAGVAATHTAGSTLPSYLLLALIGLAAVGVGLIASRRGSAPK
jgi:hypothetical protein